MFILELTYIAPLERIEAAHPEHVAWLDSNYESGVFIASGPKDPRDGAVIVAVGVDRTQIEDITRSDPYSVAGLAEYTVTNFLAMRTSPALEEYRHQPPPSR
ncbi:YciI family protein [Kitasatospora sp. NPDC048286]|uniref:YciI family protein n=1 Tax=unclassified Kitasatospora TaxID=2633591 RepID=UPI003722BEFE